MSKVNTTQDAKMKALNITDKATSNHEGKSMNTILAGLSLESLMGKGAVLPTVNEKREVGVNMNWIEQVAADLLFVANAYGNTIPEELTVKKVAEYIEWVFANRINYCEYGTNAVHPRNIQYPVMIYDALARLTRYDNSGVDGAQVIPTLSSELKEKFVEEGSNKVKALDGHDAIVRNMKIAGIELATGLPMTRTSSVRTMYEMSVDTTNDSVTTAGQVPSIAEVFGRCFYELEALTELVGMQKVQLILYTTIKNSIYDICERYVIKQRG